jgi:hypothetical protein
MADAVATSQTPGKAQPYSPSWIDRITDWVGALPGPAWLFYVGLGLTLYLIEVAIQWSNGERGQLHPYLVVLVGFIPYALALIHYLDRRAETALDQFRPALNCSDAEYVELRYRLTTLPARPVLLITLIGLVFGILILFTVTLSILNFYQTLYVSDSPLSVVFNQILGFSASILFWVVGYHTWHQLHLTSEIYKQYTHVDLFDLGPLYAFSSLSAYTTIGILPLAYTWAIFLPELLNDPSIFRIALACTVLAAVIFIRPLTGIHGLLAQEKGRLLGENGQRLKTSIAELHRRVDSGDITDMDNLNKTMANLELEQAALNRVSTWPWQPDTPRWVLAALLFPLLVWIIQWILERVLSV